MRREGVITFAPCHILRMSEEVERLTMLSFELWRTLHQTPAPYPLLYVTRERPFTHWSLVQQMVTDYLPVAVIVLMVLSVWLLGLVVIAAAALLVIFGGAFYGLLTVYTVSRAVSRHRTRGHHELIMMTPPGIFGIQWAISAYALQRSDTLVLLRGIMRRVYLAAFMVLGLIFCFTLMTANQPMTKYAPNIFMEYVLPAVLNGFCLVSVHYLDFTRSGLTGALFGLLIPTFIENRRQAVALAVTLYLAVQGMFYLACWIVGFEMLRQGLTLAGVPSEVMHNSLRLVIMLVIREISLFGLWRWLLWRLNVTPLESRQELVRR